MQQSNLQAPLLRKLSPENFPMEKVLVFWVVCVLLPAAAIFCLLNYSQANSLAARKAQTIDAMLESLETLQKACQPEEHFAKQIMLAENKAGLPPRNSALSPSLKQTLRIPERLSKQFTRFKNQDMLLLLSMGSDLTKVNIFNNQQKFPDYPKPGKRAAIAVMREYFSISSGYSPQANSDESGKKLLKNFTESIFGTYLNPITVEKDFYSGFSEKFAGSRLFIARRLLLSPDRKPLFGYIALFRESDNSLYQSFANQRKTMPDHGFACKLILRKATPFPFIFEQTDGSLRLFGPVPFGHLMAGFFRNKDMASSLIRRGIMQHKPAIFPHFEIYAPASTVLRDVSSKKHGFIIFIFLCISLLFIKQFHQHGMLRVSIKGRLFISVLIATALPATIFIFYAQRYINLQFELRKGELARKMQNHLKLLELAVKSKDETHSSKNAALVKKIRDIGAEANADELYKILNEGLDKTFSGVSLIRSDGLFLERLDSQKASTMRLEKKIKISSELMYASMIRFFQILNLMQEQFTKQLQSTSRGKKLLAMAKIFDPIDIDNFCSYEGTAQTSKRDFGTFRLLNYKILPPENSQNPKAAVLLLIQDIKELASVMLDEFAQDWSFFRHHIGEGVVNVTFVSCFDLNATILDTSKIWPPHSSLSSHQQVITHKIAQGKSEAMLVTEENDGSPTIYIGRKIAGYPLIALAECRMSKLAEQRAIASAIITGIVIYILILLTILANILNELFTPPIEKLLNAAKLTGEGHQVVIENSFNNELAHLTNEFNLMSKRIKERERLGRFISKEAAETIAMETRSLQETASQKVNRSILFIHIKNFSELNASLNPDELLKLLNIYFPFVEDIINRADGQIDKYISDGIMAVFADLQGSSSALRSCQAIMALKNCLPDLNSQLLGSKLPSLALGAGISTGEVISGRIGSYKGRLDYTVIGDRVNLAARLESLSHFNIDTRILIDDATYLATSHLCNSIFHGEIRVKGKNLPVKSYELIS